MNVVSRKKKRRLTLAIGVSLHTVEVAAAKACILVLTPDHSDHFAPGKRCTHRWNGKQSTPVVRESISGHATLTRTPVMTISAIIAAPIITDVERSASQKVLVLNTQGLTAQLTTTNAKFHTYSGRSTNCPALKTFSIQGGGRGGGGGGMKVLKD